MVPLFSLPGAHGIGDIDSLYHLIERVRNLGIEIIQLLPLNALSGNDTSPYSSISAFGMDPIYLSLGRLKYLNRSIDVVESGTSVQYSEVRGLKLPILRESFKNFQKDATPFDQKRYQNFYRENQEWLEPFSIFHALSSKENKAFWDWDQDHQDLKSAREWANSNEEEVNFYRYLQWIFFEQWSDLKLFAAENGLVFMGDLPLYVSKNSADYWSEPGNFKKGVRAGVPPDLYAAEGQDWGNPIYDWKKMGKDGFSWWKKRLVWLENFFDLVRLDHIRGIYSYWAVPDGKKPNQVKRWTPGPASDLIRALKDTQIELIGEDLGSIPPAIDKWMKDIDIPGYKVFLFGWGEYKSEKYRFPETYSTKTLACTSTHDSESFFEFLENMDDSRVFELAAYLGIKPEEEFTILDFLDRVIDRLLKSPSQYVIFPLQDLLGKSIRINLPGSVGEDNWSKTIPITEHDQSRLELLGERILSKNLSKDSKTPAPLDS